MLYALRCVMAAFLIALQLWLLRAALKAAPPLAAAHPGRPGARVGQRSPERPRSSKDGQTVERPGVEPGALGGESTYARGESMHSVPQAPSSRRFTLGPAQTSALRRWHGLRGQGELIAQLHTQPHFPLVLTGGHPRPPRRPLRPKGGPGHAA